MQYFKRTVAIAGVIAALGTSLQPRPAGATPNSLAVRSAQEPLNFLRSVVERPAIVLIIRYENSESIGLIDSII